MPRSGNELPCRSDASRDQLCRVAHRRREVKRTDRDLRRSYRLTARAIATLRVASSSRRAGKGIARATAILAPCGPRYGMHLRSLDS